MQSLNNALSGVTISVIKSEEFSSEILLYPPNLITLDSFRFFVNRLRDRALACRYPQYALDTTVLDYYQRLEEEDKAEWPVLMVPRSDSELISEFLCRVFLSEIEILASMLCTSQGVLFDLLDKVSDEEKCRIFIGDEPKKIVLDGQEKLIPGLSLCERFIGMSIPDEIGASSSSLDPDQGQSINVELLAQLCSAYEGTAPLDWSFFTVDFAQSFLEATGDIRQKQKEAMEREKDGSVEPLSPKPVETAYADIDESKNSLSEDDSLTFDLPGVDIPDA